jgi:hypothetical protein
MPQSSTPHLLRQAGSGKEIKGVLHFSVAIDKWKTAQPTRKRQCHELDCTPDHYPGVIHYFYCRASSVRRNCLANFSRSACKGASKERSRRVVIRGKILRNRMMYVLPTIIACKGADLRTWSRSLGDHRLSLRGETMTAPL